MFTDLQARHRWRPLHGCPGRWILAEGVVALSVEELTGGCCEVVEEQLPGAVDPVAYCVFAGGGLISYRKPDGYLHTLCDEAGLARKLALLRGE